jgi:CRP/FNR family cyclic AMP-dependent transcriptional regulator
LRSSPLFSHLDDSDADAILADARVVRYSEGTQIFAKGDPDNSIMAVLHGRVTISNPSADGRQLVVTTFREGDVFGEMALLDGKERSADAAADCDLLVVPRRAFLRLLEQRPEVCIDLMVVLCKRLRRTNEQVEDFAFFPLQKRMAKLLLRLVRDEIQQSSSRPGLKSWQRALGELVGGSRESVNKQLQDWKRAGIIMMEKGSIVIRDVEALVDYPDPILVFTASLIGLRAGHQPRSAAPASPPTPRSTRPAPPLR